MGGSLRGLRVLDFGQYVAGPYAAMLLAEQGADVIRVEPPGGPRWQSSANAQWNRKKRSLVLDLKHGGDAATARTLLRDADVVIENFRPGVMARLGLEWEQLHRDNPRLISCSMPGFASDDPRAGCDAWEGVLAAATGLMLPSRARRDTDAPQRETVPMCSLTGAIQGATAIAMALIARERLGVGQRIEVPLYDAMFAVIGWNGLWTNDPRAHHFVPLTPWVSQYRCKDGRWLRLHLVPRYIVRFMQAAGVAGWIDEGLHDRSRVFRDPELTTLLRARLTTLFATRTAEEWERLVSAAQSCAAVARTWPEWLAHAAAPIHRLGPLNDAAAAPWQPHPAVLLETTPAVEGAAATATDGRWLAAPAAAAASGAPTGGAYSQGGVAPGAYGAPLQGTRVLDLSLIVSGPAAARVLADYGAEVVRIEQNERDIRHCYHLDVNKGKLSSIIDLKTKDGMRLALELARASDVVVENFRPGVADRIGIGPAAVRDSSPRTIYCSIRAYSEGTALSERAGFEGVIQAATGMTTDNSPRKPLLHPYLFNDYSTGHLAALGVAAALYQRVRTGSGDRVQVSLATTATHLQLGRDPSATRAQGPAEAAGDFHQRCYPVRDGWVFVGGGATATARILRLPAMAGRIADASGVAQLLAGMSAERAVAILGSVGVGAHRVETLETVMTDPHAVAGGLVVFSAGPYGKVRSTGVSPRLSLTPLRPSTRIPAMGADVDAVLARAGRAHDRAVLESARTIHRDTPLAPLTALPELVAWWAAKDPDATAYVDVGETAAETRRISNRALLRAMQNLTAAIAQRARPGDRVLLAVPTGIDFALGFLACLAARAVAVPVPVPRGDEATARRLNVIAEDCGAALLLTSDKDTEMHVVAGMPPTMSVLDMRATADVVRNDEAAHTPKTSCDELACLIYTSGSTANPKGVVFSNRDVLEVCERVRFRGRMAKNSVAVTWSPAAHVTGLICGVAAPIYTGCLSVLMSPEAFVADPLNLLRVITRYRGTHAGGPAFTYAQCAAAATPAAVHDLALDSWQLAYVAAEPIRQSALEQFTSVFRGVGFSPSAFQACYGQTEAMRVATSRLDIAPHVIEVDANALSEGRLEPVALGSAGSALVGHGPLERADLTVAIVDPTTQSRCPVGVVGEIWVQGEGVARGYWRRPAETEHTFGARLRGAEQSGPWLRTGDLGVTDGRDLYVVGRLSDLIIVRGRKHHPVDIEATILRAEPADAVVVFATVQAGEDRVVACVEVNGRSVVPTEEVARIRRQVATAHGVMVHDVILLSAGGMPRTPSGKVARAVCREAFLRGTLRASTWPGEPALPAAGGDETARPQSALEQTIAALWQRIFRRPIGVNESFFDIGGDSLAAMQLASLARAEGLAMPVALVLQHPTIAALAARVSAIAAPARPAFTGRLALLPSQRRALQVYDVQRAAGGEANLFYITVPKILQVRPRLDRAALIDAVNAVADHHDALRTRFVRDHGAWHQVIDSALRPDAVASWRYAGELNANLNAFQTQVASWVRTWDIERDPLFRVAIAEADDEAMVVVATHHLLSDNITERIVQEDLRRAYAQRAAGEEVVLPPVTSAIAAWADVVAKAVRAPADHGGHSWRWAFADSTHAAGAAPAPALVRFHSVPMHAGIDLDALARAAGAQPFELVLAAFAGVVAKRAGRGARIDIAHHGRASPDPAVDLSRTVGMFFLDVPLRLEFDPGAAFHARRQWARSALDEASPHTFALAVESCRPGASFRPAPFGLNYQRAVDVAPDGGGGLVPAPASRRLWVGIRERFAPETFLFQSHYYAQQLRLFVLDAPRVPPVCTFCYPENTVSHQQLEEIVAELESELPVRG